MSKHPHRLVVSAPDSPLLLFDGDCAFCRFWIERWKQKSQNRLDFLPYQEAAARFPEIPREASARSVQLVLSNGEVFEGAEAVFRARALGRGRSRLLWTYQRMPGFAWVADALYRFIASHRAAAFTVTRMFFG